MGWDNFCRVGTAHQIVMFCGGQCPPYIYIGHLICMADHECSSFHAKRLPDQAGRAHGFDAGVPDLKDIATELSG